MEWIIEKGRTKEQAIEKALKRLGAKPEEVKVEVLEENRGFFSLFGERSVKIKVSYINKEEAGSLGEQSALERAKEVLASIVEKMGISCEVDGTEGQDGLYLSIRSDKGGLIIGKGGETLDALQYIVSKITQKKIGERINVWVDTEDYRKRREERVKNLARSMANKVKQSGQPITLGNLSSSDRKIIHGILKEDPEIETVSQGNGMARKIRITLKDKNKDGWID
jgi:spoIIIJ-associated protein